MNNRRAYVLVAAGALAMGLTAGPPVSGQASSRAVDSGTWQSLGVAMDNSVLALAVDEKTGRLVLGGTFTRGGGNHAADHVATWDGTTWRALGPDGSINGTVFDIVTHNGSIYIAGNFQNAGGDPAADGIAVWDGTSWKALCASLPRAYALEIVSNTLYAGGDFDDVNGDQNRDLLIACDLTTGDLKPALQSSVSSAVDVRALSKDANGALYVGGFFSNWDGIPEADFIVRYHQGQFSALGAGTGSRHGAIESPVEAIATDGDDVYIASEQNLADIPQADFIARFDGGAWHALGASINGDDGYFPKKDPVTSINDIHIDGEMVYVIGEWNNAGGDAAADNVAAWNGEAWGSLGVNGNGAWEGYGAAVTTWLGALVVGGDFRNAGGDPTADRIAAYVPLVDIREPTTQITQRPKNRVTTTRRKATVKFVFNGNDNPWPSTPLMFRCQVDNQPAVNCASPFKVSLGVGKHRFRVTAIDDAGNQDRTPAADRFTIVRKP